MSRHTSTLKLLQRLLDATRSKEISWRVEELPDKWWTATIDGSDVSFRFLWFEPTNQVGADPEIIEFTMPHMNAKFAFGTEAVDICFEILEEAFDSWKGHNSPDTALKWLNNALDNQTD